ncbi:glycosyltransferase [Asanoa sp. WMMD1127]|uniref:glycosyltransferase n=1 Tax=Asanoa sp. WMMD1127 TaxID=3016107 RepID=UPI002416726E|nr:glycosyltransferase [Asanoa sp. WMMD1127]MDG4821174.1 glycosyltransferase [Asanoa sp. WMMD1127]
MRWLAFGTYDVHRHPRVGVLIEGLRAAGDEVVEVNVPLELDTAGRVAMLRQPWRLPKLAWLLGRCWTLLALRARKAPPADAVLVGYLGHFDVRLARRLFRRTPIVLDHLVSAAGTARDRSLTAAGGGGLKSKLMRWIDRGALRSADVVVVDTDEHLAALPASAAPRGVVALVGAGAQWFAAGAARPAVRPAGPLKVIFVGLFTPLHGTAYLGEALAALAADERIQVTMVGKGQDYAACRAAAAANPRVTWVDWVTAAELPGLVAAHDVSLGIFGTTDKAQNVVPTKVFQGAAAGCAIVTSDTAPQRRTLGDDALLVPPGDAVALTETLRALAADPALLARYQRSAAARAADQFAAATVVEPIRARVGSSSPTPPAMQETR